MNRENLKQKLIERISQLCVQEFECVADAYETKGEIKGLRFALEIIEQKELNELEYKNLRGIIKGMYNVYDL